jgi:hypothetical protein
MLPFWVSIAALSLAQGALVALPGRLVSQRLDGLRGRRWALIPPLSVIGFVLVASAAERASADGLTYLALIAVPVLAAVALGWLCAFASPRLALLVTPLFAVAWIDPGGLAGEGSALVLSALSCVTLGVLLAAVTPARWLAVGIVAMAVSDTALVVSDLLQKPNNALNAAHPIAHLPRLQSEVFGNAVMGYGDVFIAGLLGALLALAYGRGAQLRAARLVALLALAFDLLFFAVDELPATVPVALALVLVILSRRSGARRPSARAHPAAAESHRQSSAAAP